MTDEMTKYRFDMKAAKLRRPGAGHRTHCADGILVYGDVGSQKVVARVLQGKMYYEKVKTLTNLWKGAKTIDLNPDLSDLVNVISCDGLRGDMKRLGADFARAKTKGEVMTLTKAKAIHPTLVTLEKASGKALPTRGRRPA